MPDCRAPLRSKAPSGFVATGLPSRWDSPPAPERTQFAVNDSILRQKGARVELPKQDTGERRIKTQDTWRRQMEQVDGVDTVESGTPLTSLLG